VLQVAGNPEGLAWGGERTILFSNNPGTEEGRLRTLSLSTREVTDLPLTEDARFPAVSPSGTQLAFARGFDNVNVWRVAPGDGAAPRPFLLSTRVQGNARFSPDGRRVVFDSTRSGAREVWLASADGSNPVQATRFNAGISGSPTWCADSRRIAFDSRRDGPVSVYVEDVLERVPRRLATDMSEIQLPSWSRDCRSLYVVAGAAKNTLYRVPSAGGKGDLLYKGVAINATEAGDGALFFADAFENARIRRLEPGRHDAELVKEMPRVRFGSAWQSPWVFAPVGLLLIAFGLSMFDVFTISLPSSLTGLQGAGVRRGGFLGALLIGVAAAFVTAPCTAPAARAYWVF
jgi:dipeptidyl aminopeptidase/acylaminoacyl peptidase